MTQNTLLLIEATGIQNYIFGSNELKQQATQDWVFAALPKPCNVRPAPGEPDGWKIEAPTVSGDWAAQVIYAGGGNAVILFADHAHAKAVAEAVSFKVLQEAPGLRIIVTLRSFDPVQRALKTELNELRKAAAERKRTPPRSAPLLGLGVTAACVYTGAPAIDRRDARWVSAEACAKQDCFHKGTERLHRHLKDVQLARCGLLADLDRLGERNEASYMALIHTDGNGMGKRIEKHGEQFNTPADNEKYAQAQYRFSEKVKEVARWALNSTVGMLLDPTNLVTDKEGQLSIGGKAPVAHDRESNLDLLPFRPIVFGGDDVTFVCEGRIGLSVAAKYVSAFASQMLEDKKPASARAGVAVVKSHYPFARAYDLAEELCVSAKQRIKELTPPDKDEQTVTVLDWHFAVSGLVLPLDEIREREYKVRDGDLLFRPAALKTTEDDWRSWKNFVEVTTRFQANDQWRGRRNKVKALREALRGGPAAVQMFLAGESLPAMLAHPDRQQQTNAELQRTGWWSKRCGYFDAVEALDFYTPLRGEVE